MILGLGHRLGRPVLVDGSDLELLQVAPVLVRAGRLSLGLVGGQLVVLVAHRLSRSPRVVGDSSPGSARDGTQAAMLSASPPYSAIAISIASNRPMSASSASIFAPNR